MDSARLALEYLVAGNVSDALLARATRELLGRRVLARASRPVDGREGEVPPPSAEAKVGETLPAPDVPAERPAPPQEPMPGPDASRAVQSRSGGITGLRPELVRVNVRIDGRRTSLSFPKPEWAVLMRRYGGRQPLLQATESFATAFKGRGSRSAWVLDQLEARTMREGAAAAAAEALKATAAASSAGGTPSLFPELPSAEVAR